MTSFSFSCNIDKQNFVGFVTFDEESKVDVSGNNKLNDDILKAVLFCIQAGKEEPGKPFSIKIHKTHTEIELEVVKNLWKKLDLPQEIEVKGDLVLSPVRQFSPIRDFFPTLIKKTTLIFNRIFKTDVMNEMRVDLPLETYERALELLNKMKQKVLGPDDLLPEDKTKVEQLLERVMGNVTFNRYIHHKKDKSFAEDILDDLSFATRDEKIPSKEMEAILGSFEKLGVSQIHSAELAFVQGFEEGIKE